MCLTGDAIGQGLPVAVGAAVACRDRRVIALESDGSAMYTLQSLWTMVRESLDVTTILFNNGSYAVLNMELGRVGAEAGPRAKAMLEAFGVTEETWRAAVARVPHFCCSESPAFVGRAAAALASDPDVARWSGQSLSSGALAQVYGFTDVDGTRPDAWRYIVEVREAGLPADDTGYR